MVEPARAAQLDFKPHLFGKFLVLQRLAVGGMAEIYRAKVVGAAGFEKELALKRILPSRSQDEGFIKMLVNEAKLTAQLTHSNIAQIYECGEVEGAYFIAMELVHGVSMKEMMGAFARASMTLTPEQAIFLVLQLLHGLDYAHRKTDAGGEPLRVVHCDVSPDNALVSWEGELKLLDFGIARAATGLSNYKEGMLMGKLGYVAPEQASIEKPWDHRVDLLAAGIILYELLTHQKPFPKATDVESLVASRKAKVPAPSALDNRIPRELDAILAHALAWDPEKRYPSARAFADALVDVLFPTPHSAIQDLLGQQMRQVFSERIARQRAARAHDALVVKVLQHLLERQQGAGAAGALSASPMREIAPCSTSRRAWGRSTRWGLASSDQGRGHSAAGSRSGRRPHSPSCWRESRSRGPGRASCGSGPACSWSPPIHQARGCRWTAATWRPPPRPCWRTSTFPGRSRSSSRPGTERASPCRWSRSWASWCGASTPRCPRRWGRSRWRAHRPEREVLIDEHAAGVTPLTIGNVRLDERHRLDLTLAGHELDQFVVLPEKDGQRFFRTLAPVQWRSGAPPRGRP